MAHVGQPATHMTAVSFILMPEFTSKCTLFEEDDKEVKHDGHDERMGQDDGRSKE